MVFFFKWKMSLTPIGLEQYFGVGLHLVILIILVTLITSFSLPGLAENFVYVC